MTTPSKLYKLHKERCVIAGVTVKGAGTVSHQESSQAVKPSGGLRPGKTCIIGIEEKLIFQLEEATTANVPAVGASGSSEFDAQELTGGTTRAAGIKGTAASSVVRDVRRAFNTGGVPVIEIEVDINSTDEETAGIVWAAGAS